MLFSNFLSQDRHSLSSSLFWWIGFVLISKMFLKYFSIMSCDKIVYSLTNKKEIQILLSYTKISNLAVKHSFFFCIKTVKHSFYDQNNFSSFLTKKARMNNTNGSIKITRELVNPFPFLGSNLPMYFFF